MRALLTTQQLTIQIANNPICHTLDLEIKPGEIWGILGPNGSGKTTLLHTLAGLQKPLSGEIYLDKDNLADLSQKSIARQLGILLQDTQPVFPQTVFDFCLAGRYPHLSTFAWESRDDIRMTKEALSAMDLEARAEQDIFTLSGGERRRLAIATLLTQRPRIYLLDEPTNHLDLHHQIKVMDHFHTLARQQSVAIVQSLHDINLAQRYCTHVVLLLGQAEIAIGTPQALFVQENLSRLYQHPIRKISINNEQIWVPY